MRILALWSGGLDSTYMLQYLSEQGHEVYAGYVAYRNNREKTTRELEAIDKIRETEFFHRYRIKYLGTIYDVKVDKPARNMQLNQPLMWLSALAYAIGNDTEAVAIGYVMNDDAISFIDDFKNIYESFKPLVFNLPPLMFPLTKLPKEVFWKRMDDEVKSLITWCENTGDKNDCGQCQPCIRMKHLGLSRPSDEVQMDPRDRTITDSDMAD